MGWWIIHRRKRDTPMICVPCTGAGRFQSRTSCKAHFYSMRPTSIRVVTALGRACGGGVGGTRALSGEKIDEFVNKIV